MIAFNASMLREKFLIETLDKGSDDSMMVLSNRLDIPLLDAQGKLVQHIIIRGKFMHHVLRFGAFIIEEYNTRGPLNNRIEPIDYKEVWRNILTDFDQSHEPDSWVVLFEKGVSFFASHDVHPFLDVIEQCDFQNTEDYDFAVAMAEGAFQKTGQNVKIDYSGTLAMITSLKDGAGKCGLICRSPNETNTFSFKAEEERKPNKDNKPLESVDLISICADFLEIVQLGFSVGFIKAKLDLKMIKDTDPDAKKMRSANKRTNNIKDMITLFENNFKVRYRPEKPNFANLVSESRKRARSLLIK